MELLCKNNVIIKSTQIKINTEMILDHLSVCNQHFNCALSHQDF